MLGHSFNAGDVVCHSSDPASVYWLINKEQYVSIELYPYGELEGHEGLYMSGNKASDLDWSGYVKVCTIEQLRDWIINCLK